MRLLSSVAEPYANVPLGSSRTAGRPWAAATWGRSPYRSPAGCRPRARCPRWARLRAGAHRRHDRGRPGQPCRQPALKLPTLRRGGSLVFGAQNICRAVAEMADPPRRASGRGDARRRLAQRPGGGVARRDRAGAARPRHRHRQARRRQRLLRQGARRAGGRAVLAEREPPGGAGGPAVAARCQHPGADGILPPGPPRFPEHGAGGALSSAPRVRALARPAALRAAHAVPLRRAACELLGERHEARVCKSPGVPSASPQP
jgi:hypothetical protein